MNMDITRRQYMALFKNFKKNEYIFYKKLLKNPAFLRGLERLCIEYNNCSFDLKSVDIKERLRLFDELLNPNNEYRITVLKTKEHLPHLFVDISKFLYNNDLGEEWTQTIVLIIFEKILIPPIFNLNISTKGVHRGRLRVLLELNPDTSIDDIKVAWNNIKNEQKRLYPEYRSTKITERTFKNLNLYIKDQVLKKDTLKNLTGYKKIGDIDKVGYLTPGENDISKKADIKRTQHLRQIRHRLKP